MEINRSLVFEEMEMELEMQMRIMQPGESSARILAQIAVVDVTTEPAVTYCLTASRPAYSLVRFVTPKCSSMSTCVRPRLLEWLRPSPQNVK
ncbi:uncharacterized protein [Drosophila kikkawai]|uniref:Uncharacterized protein isoform X2 n=1 Tax=Drosophila kikkawai TaxID=30033 RepID=A0ABM4GP91_DROKI